MLIHTHVQVHTCTHAHTETQTYYNRKVFVCVEQPVDSVCVCVCVEQPVDSVCVCVCVCVFLQLAKSKHHSGWSVAVCLLDRPTLPSCCLFQCLA